MNTLLKWFQPTRFGRRFGLCFAPDNTVVPVMRHHQFNRLEEGYFRISYMHEETLPPISVGFRSRRYPFSGLMTQDNIPFGWQPLVRFQFDPREAPPAIQKRIIYAGEEGLYGIVRDRTEHILRHRVADFTAQDLYHSGTQKRIEETITRFLNDNLKIMGFMIPIGGVMLGQPEMPPEFKRMVFHQRRLHHLKQMLAADGELCAEDKLILALATFTDENVAGNGQTNGMSATNLATTAWHLSSMSGLINNMRHKAMNVPLEASTPVINGARPH